MLDYFPLFYRFVCTQDSEKNKIIVCYENFMRFWTTIPAVSIMNTIPQKSYKIYHQIK